MYSYTFKAFEILTRQIVDKSGNKVSTHVQHQPLYNMSIVLQMLSRRQEDVIDLKQKEDSNKCSC